MKPLEPLSPPSVRMPLYEKAFYVFLVGFIVGALIGALATH